MVDTLAILCTLVVGFYVVIQEMNVIRRNLVEQKRFLAFIAETLLIEGGYIIANDDVLEEDTESIRKATQ